ncbi:UDP-galactopyranose mutase [Mucilaginibacter ginkgonis]|uniref:UDP-galactopyranose mutase n=1 Tax=Mucilaginibacter ginkgonis TaxID=2682091 RepID=A0A6I4HUK7_9SPHI|nr:UDP-galactopyranose mutase [Mucilaginibacter ginkgonis]QQL50212.1 UDP-galactopyranose mutase [Mucilaginibacter ginkgonis]
MKEYDYLIVGAGLYGAVFACEAFKRGKRCLVLDKRSHIAGNIYTEDIEGIKVHKYGAHIFHTNNRVLWDYVNGYAEFNRYTNSPLANYKGELFNMPFNMNTFHALWNVKKPDEAKKIIDSQVRSLNIQHPRNLEEQALSMVGYDVYEKLIKGYTEKQWGRKATELPAFIIKRLPVRYTFDNNYFNDRYQGIPIGGYTKIVDKLLSGVEVRLETDYLDDRHHWNNLAECVVYTGMIDQFFNYCFGILEYRSLFFEHEVLDCENYQGNAVVNYTDVETPFTRIIEHKHFEFGNQTKTVITKEYPKQWKVGDEPYYPVNDDVNNLLFQRYKNLAQGHPNIIFGGRLGGYKYYDMHQVIAIALKKIAQIFDEKIPQIDE